MDRTDGGVDAQKAAVEAQISRHEEELQRLRVLLKDLSRQKNDSVAQRGSESVDKEHTSQIDQLDAPPKTEPECSHSAAKILNEHTRLPERYPLDLNEYRRYGRQLILPEVGLTGQLRLKQASVLIIGAGGLGCPAAAYLAGAGVGHVGLVDGDTVETSNLHRQILHSSVKVGSTKIKSVTDYLRDLNPIIKLTGFEEHLTPLNAIDIVGQFDLVLDCTDTPASRYLISDACVLLGKPLVSASALKTEGQLMVLNYPARKHSDPAGGPCYRCVFPRPPPAETVVSCGEGGILGPVVGLMGVLQALETIKIIVRGNSKEDTIQISAGVTDAARQHSLLLFSAYGSPQFRTIRLRGRKANCIACSSTASITEDSLSSGSLDYVQFCGITAPVNLLPAEDRITASQALKAVQDAKPGLLIDVRERVQFDLCNIDASVNIPFSMFPPLSNGSDHVATPAARAKLDAIKSLLDQLRQAKDATNDINVICRQGNDSQIVVQHLKNLRDNGDIDAKSIKDVQGGLITWRKDVDPDFPVY